MKKQKTKSLMIGNKSFEDLKQINQHGAEYWSARDLQPLLGYSQWRRFEQAIERAVTSCKQSENPAEHHFASAGKPITANHSPLNPTQHHFAGAGKPIAYTART